MEQLPTEAEVTGVTFYCVDGPAENGVPLLPEVHFSPRNARNLLVALGLCEHGDLYGMLDLEEIPCVSRRVMFLLNHAKAREPLLPKAEFRPSRVIKCPSTGLPRIVRGARILGGDTFIVRKLQDLQELLKQASEFGCDVHWG